MRGALVERRKQGGRSTVVLCPSGVVATLASELRPKRPFALKHLSVPDDRVGRRDVRDGNPSCPGQLASKQRPY